MMPTDIRHYESTVINIHGVPTTIGRVPSRKYKERRVRDFYINEKGERVNLRTEVIVGGENATKNNTNQWLPKNKKDMQAYYEANKEDFTDIDGNVEDHMQYINEEYYRLKDNNPNMFAVLNALAEEHLATQDFKSIIPNITKLIYINSMKPQNKNFRVVDLARNKCEFYDGKKWITGKTMDELIKIFENVNTVITDPFEEDKIYKTIKFIENNEELRKKSNWINWSKNYCLSLWDENDKENVGKRNDILNEIKLIFYNNRDEILKLDV
jgi:hypothetical protein